MPQCCRCNGSGRCNNCSCKKSGRCCVDCLPHRRNRCENRDEQNHDESASASDRTRQTAEELPNTEERTSLERGNSGDDLQFTSLSDLPLFNTSTPPKFVWGDTDGETLSSRLDKAYEEVVNWKRNLFEVPRGKAGTDFVSEVSRLIEAYNDATALESIAMKAVMVMPSLLLQRPHARSNNKDHIQCLEDRLLKWKKGDLDRLVHEGRTIQSQLNVHQSHHQDEGRTARSFEKLVAVGNVKAALRLITEHQDRGCLPLDSLQSDGRTVKQHLLDKHPPGQPAMPSAISDSPPAEEPHQVIFDQIDGPLIRSIVQRMDGSAGPSGLNASDWKRMCSSFRRTSEDLCKSIARLTRKLCSCYVDPEGISALVACRLIALDKCPGVRPVGIGETLRRLISKAVLQVARDDIQRVVGCLQLCAGQEAACEAGILAMRSLFEDGAVEAVLLVDASNAFNSLNREAALLNTRILCPILAPMLTNTYRSPARLFIGGEHILSQEGTTQGDPLAMAMYALGTLPLIHKLQEDVTQAWYADDATAGGEVAGLRRWWDKLRATGPQYGYHPNPSKTWLVVKPEHLPAAEEQFHDTGVKVTSQGQRHLGAALGSKNFVEDFVREKVSLWVSELEKLSRIAKYQPQAAHVVYTHGLMHRWTFLMRTVPGVEELFQPLEEAIRHQFLPALTGRDALSDTERALLALPARHGGLGIPMPTAVARRQFPACSSVTAPLVELIQQQSTIYPVEARLKQRQVKAAIRTSNRSDATNEAIALKPKLSNAQQCAMEQASEKGASSWLTAIPLAKYDFSLHKQAFRDALCLRFGWTPTRLPSHCPCGKPFTVDHAFSCPKGAFPSIRHDRIRDITARLLTEVCSNVGLEPTLQPLTGESFPLRSANTEEGARLDIKAQNFWDSSQRSTFFDVRVFNSFAPSNSSSSTNSTYRRHEKEKRRAYEQRILQVEHGTFTPLVLSSSGGWGPSAMVAFRRLASLIATKHRQSYSATLSFIRCKIGYSLIQSGIMCLRGPRSSFHAPAKAISLEEHPLDLIRQEVRLF